MVHLKDSTDTGIGNSSASFSPATGNRVVTVGYGIGCGTPGTEKLRLYDTSDENLTKHSGKKYLAPYKKISHANPTGKLVTQIRAEWHPRIDDILFIGSYYGYSRVGQFHRIDVLTNEGIDFPMTSEYLKSVCSIVKCHPSQDIVVGANSYGEVHVFMEQYKSALKSDIKRHIHGKKKIENNMSKCAEHFNDQEVSFQCIKVEPSIFKESQTLETVDPLLIHEFKEEIFEENEAIPIQDLTPVYIKQEELGIKMNKKMR